MNRLGFHLLGVALALGFAPHSASAQNLPSATAPAASDLQNDERDMLARARAEMERNRSRASTGEIDSRDAAGDAVRDQAIKAEVDRRIREAEREAELDQVTAAIRRSAAMRAPAAPVAPPVDEPEIASAPGSLPTATFPVSTRATVLLAMEPGHTGIRVLDPTADPILCMPDVCWISRGPDRDARMVPRRKALGPLNTLGDRAGACNGRTTCVFHNVELTDASMVIQPVDLRILKHDRRAPLQVRVDTTCRIERRGLSCSERQAGSDYRVWIVPEAIAQAAGSSALLAAVDRTTATAQRSMH